MILRGLPEPARNEDASAFWDGCDRGELRVQRCIECREYRWPPGPVCPRCGDLGGAWINAKGTGTLYSWVTVEVPLVADIEDQVPYVVGLIELDEGPRIVSTISDSRPHLLSAGLPLKVRFDEPTNPIFTFVVEHEQ